MKPDHENGRACGLLVLHHHGWFEDILFVCSDLEMYCPSNDAVGLAEVHNPYHLPVTDRLDVVLVTTEWYLWLSRHHPDKVDSVFSALRRASGAVVGYEGFDTFDLGFPAAGFDHLDVLIKAQGVYNDRDRYNWRSGPMFSRDRRHQRPIAPTERYHDRHLQKLRLSVPCFLGVDRRVRNQVRHAKPDISGRTDLARRIGDMGLEAAVTAGMRIARPTKTVHCVGTLSHVTRLDLFRLLDRVGVSGSRGVTGVPLNVFGTEYLDGPVPEALRTEWTRELEGLGVLTKAQSRPLYRLRMLAHRSVLAPTGYGEITFRHAEAWLSGRALVCPDVSFADTMFPFADQRNVLFCADDWSDLPEILTALEQDENLWATVARGGRRDWQSWSADYRGLLRRGIVDHLDEVSKRTRLVDRPSGDDAAQAAAGSDGPGRDSTSVGSPEGHGSAL